MAHPAVASEIIKIEPPCSSSVNGIGTFKCGDIYVHTSGVFSLACGFCEAVEFYTLVEYSNHQFNCHFPNGIMQSSMKFESNNDHCSPQDTTCHVLGNLSEVNSNTESTKISSPFIKELVTFDDKLCIAVGEYDNIDPLWTSTNSALKTNVKDMYFRKGIHQSSFARLSSYTCCYCKEELASRKLLLNHMHKVHFFGYGCSFCCKRFFSTSSQRRHERLAHPSRCYCQKPECQKCPYQKKYANILQCVDCQSTFPRRSELQLHMWKAHSIGYPCRVCGRHFMLSSNRNAHERTHTSKRQHQCQYCQRTFTLRTTLNDHTKLHTGERPFLCTICGNGFVSNAKLNTHTKRVHSTEPNHYPCSICGAKFSKSYHLKQHKEKQHNMGLNPCSCDICKRIFTNRKCLVQHMKIHGKKTYKCRYCDMTFAQAAGKRGHERNKHEDICV